MKIEKTVNVPELQENATALVFSPENGNIRFDIYVNAETDLDTGLSIDSVVAAHGLAHIFLNYPDMVNNAYIERMTLFGLVKEDENTQPVEIVEEAVEEKEVETDNSTEEKANA